MSNTITIAGKEFILPADYEAGHVLSASEASALSQTRNEKLRSKFTKTVKTALANGFDQTALQASFDALAADYNFDGRTRTRVRDPVMLEALVIAKAKIRQLMKAKGRDPTQAQGSAITAAAKDLINRDPRILEQAHANIVDRQSAASEDYAALIAEIPDKVHAG